jgi:phenylalanyl-tRNA synthetase beta chain
VAQAAIHRPHRVYAGLSRFPSVRRDLAVVVDQEVSAAAVEKVVRHALGEVLVEFRLFDVYVGKGIDSNEKSLALGLTLQSRDATLTEDTIGLRTEAAVDALRDAFSARLR